MARMTEDYEKISIAETVKTLQTDKDKGLASEEAKKRIAEYGYNEIPEKEESIFHRIFRRFWGPIPGM
ncbi:MAG: hypothetical protein GXP46_06580, partial [Deferribacteres bacterium]|nr:hypothetical protein [Deferribacteres bacterium]